MKFGILSYRIHLIFFTPPWRSDVAMPVGYRFGTSCLSPIDNSTVFLIGGRTWIANTNTYSYTSTVGINHGDDDNITTTVYNDMNILDITTIIWSTQTQSQSVPANVDYTATLLPSGLIVYIGGRGSNSANLNNISQNGNIIIYGGSISVSSVISNVFSDIAVLNTNSWVWSVPSVSGTSAQTLTQYSATLYKNYMILAFEEYVATPGDDHMREKHVPMVYTLGILPPETFVLTPMYGVPVPANN
ncbi:hypothetical protein F8M41_003655 [Gigaspora margarita]|uniref:Kelch repeat protein n=1 Tax=Gigaspora margarita TaxID=4874 RepID=A0A8H3XB13_GIGMA|nr:hypothetical protein F8M41_003655 [Gigaspora margarita]